LKVILLQDIEKLGKKYDIKRVSNGYARNFLIPKCLAKLADKQSLLWLEKEKEKIEKRAEESLKKVQELASEVSGHEVTILVKVGEEGQLFESVTVQKIAEQLKVNGFDIKRAQIILEEPIRELGEFPVKIKFTHNLEIEINIIVAEEK